MHVVGAVGMMWFALPETVFGWVLCEKKHPQEHQDPGSPLEHCIAAMISVITSSISSFNGVADQCL